MNAMDKRLSRLEQSGAAPMQIFKVYDGEAAPACNGALTVIIRKPGRRP